MPWFAWPPRRDRLSDPEPPPTKAERPGPGSVNGALSDDCAAFLLGTLAEYRVAHNQIVCAWEWMNLLAHGEVEDLRSEVAGVEQHRSPLPSATGAGWRTARSYLASELLDLIERGTSLRELQQQTLVPLELELACDPQATRWRPHQWVLTVESALGASRKATRPPIDRGSRLPP